MNDFGFYDTGCRIEAKILHNRVCQLSTSYIHMVH